MGLLSYITGTTPQSEQDAGLNKETALYNSRLAAREAAGTVTPTQDAALHDYINSVHDDSELAAYGQGALEGAQQGLNNVLDFPGKVVGAVGDAAGKSVWGIFKNIPWWVYLGAAVAGFFYLGGGILLRGLITKKAASL